MRPKQIRKHPGLVAALAVYVLLALAYMLVIPAGESPDEPGHLQCVEQVAVYGRVPITQPSSDGHPWWTRGATLSGRMCYHMPLYFGVAGGIVKVIGELTATPLDHVFPEDNPAYTKEPLVPVFLNSAESPLTRQIPPTLLALRLFSIALGAITIIATYQVALRFFPAQRAIATLAALLLAGWPQFLFNYRAISNDGLSATLAIVALALLTRIEKPQTYLTAATLCVLATLAKLTSWFTIIVLAVLFLIDFAKRPQRWRDYLRVGMIGTVGGLTTAGLLWLHPTIGRHLRFSFRSFNKQLPQAATLEYWQDVFGLTLSSGYLRFGWMDIAAPQWQANAWWLAIAITFALGVGLFLRRPNAQKWRLLALLVCWLALMLLSYYRVNANRFQPQFRFMLAALPLICIMSAAGIQTLLRNRPRQTQLATAALGALLVALNLWQLLTLIVPVYYG